MSESTCFVAQPFHEPFSRYYDAVFKPAIEDVGLRPIRGDSIFRAGDIVGQVVEMLVESAVVLGEISMLNANVYYELGIAHTIGKPTVLVTQAIDVVPFDLRALRIIVYNKDDPHWGETLRVGLAKALTETITKPSLSVPIAVTAALKGMTERKESDTTRDRDLAEVSARIDSLQRAVQVSLQVDTLPSQRSPRAQAARETIEQLIQNGLTDSEISDRMVSNGVTRLWTEETLHELREGMRRRPVGGL